MKVNATETELTAIAEVLKLAAILDDRAPAADRARIVAWAEQTHRHRLTREDLLDGLQAFYDSPADHAIAVGDLVHHGRRAKSSRLDKEADEQREHRQETLDIKVADEQRAFAASMPMGPVTSSTPRLDKARNALQFAFDKTSAKDAIREFFAAKREAQGKPALPVPAPAEGTP